MEEQSSAGESHLPQGRLRLVAEAPLLIVGAPRSGTTWLQRTLLGHPGCCGGQESHFFASLAKVVDDFDRKAAMPRAHGLAAHVTRARLHELLREFWVEVMRATIEARPEATLLVEKTPDHATHLALVDAVLPECRVVHLVRDSRAVVASLLRAGREPWGRPWAPRSAEAAARRWLECVEGAESAAARLGPQRFMRMHYESLRHRGAEVLPEILRFADLPHDPQLVHAMISGASTDAVGRGGSSIALHGDLEGRDASEPPGFARNSAAEDWRSTLGFREKRRVWRLTAEVMQRLGYDRDSGFVGEGRH